MKKTLETTTAVATDLGEFTAIAAAYSVDRVNERIIEGAFEKTIASWQESGKNIPLHWDHEGDADKIIGYVDPKSMREVEGEGLEVSGKLDLEDSKVAKETWRLMKNNAVSLSFGYMVKDQTKAKDGVIDLKELDVFEVSITPAPANPDTRVISMKSLLSEFTREEFEAIAELIPQTEFSSDIKDRLTEKAQRVLDQKSAVEETVDEEPTKAKSHAQDLRSRSDRVAESLSLEGVDLSVQPPAPEPKPEPRSAKEIEREFADVLLQLHS